MYGRAAAPRVLPSIAHFSSAGVVGGGVEGRGGGGGGGLRFREHKNCSSAGLFVATNTSALSRATSQPASTK